MDTNSIDENEILNETNTNETTESIVVDNSEQTELLTNIHTDLQFIICFIVFFVLVVLLKYVYKFFSMFFVI